MGSSEKPAMGHRTLILLLLVFVLCNPVACLCECNGMGAGTDGEYAPCQSVWGEGLNGDPDLRRFCFVDPGVCEDQKNLTGNIFWSHLACYKLEYFAVECPFTNVLCQSVSSRLVSRYGGGGSG